MFDVDRFKLYAAQVAVGFKSKARQESGKGTGRSRYVSSGGGVSMKSKNRAVRILVSACLTGERVRYDGAVIPVIDTVLVRWVHESRVVSFCPETAGGLPVPRPPSEIANGDGAAVLNGDAAVVNTNGDDVTGFFLNGARKAVDLARSLNIKMAVLKDKSPSCGSTAIYDGSFSGRNKSGSGVTTALLERAGVRVFSEREIVKADAHLKTIER